MGTGQAAYYGHQNMVEFLLDKAGAHSEREAALFSRLHSFKNFCSCLFVIAVVPRTCVTLWQVLVNIARTLEIDGN